MGIYITNIEMPQDEEMLCVNIYPDGKVCISLDLECKRIATAVAVPPLGRLIDADAFIGTIRPLCEEDKFAACTFETVKRLMVEHINNAPTIIPPAEET